MSGLFLGWGGLFAVMLIRRIGRLPVLFWSQVRRLVELGLYYLSISL